MNAITTLVSELREWLDQSRERLEENGVSITDKLPGKGDNEQSKGCIGLSRGHIIASFTAWDKRPIPVEFLVYNTHIDKMIIMDDYEVQSIADVLKQIDAVSDMVTHGKYDDMKPDPRLSIT